MRYRGRLPSFQSIRFFFDPIEKVMETIIVDLNESKVLVNIFLLLTDLNCQAGSFSGKLATAKIPC